METLQDILIWPFHALYVALKWLYETFFGWT
jgi:hypothetical protein